MSITELVAVVLFTVVCMAVGMFVGSLRDRGRRGDGDMWNDLPSTIGFAMGGIVAIIMVGLYG